MMRYSLAVAAVTAGLLVGPALGHHSFAMFDQAKTLTIEGTVTRFQWTAPHSWIDVAVTDSAGKVHTWAIETGPPSALSRRGWKKNSLKAGDKVVVLLHPLRAVGEFGGALVSVKNTASGEVFLDKGPLQRRDAKY